MRQERFASSVESGLLANLVAKRCSMLRDKEQRGLVWFLQWLSWMPGGLTDAARQIGRAFESLQRLCLDPSSEPEWEAVAEYRRAWRKSQKQIVRTRISEAVFGALDYARQAGCVAVIDGSSRIGKSFSARAWCESAGGIARYVEVPSSNDDMSFFRAIARSLGVSASLKLKAAEIRNRVEDVLQGGDLMLVLDEAHYLWPQSWYRYAAPSRVNWLMTAVANHGVSLALITTPQFFSAQKEVERLTKWNSDQFVGRLGHVEKLPSRLEIDDLLAITRALLPECDATTSRAIAGFARSSPARLGSIVAIASRAHWFASQEGRKPRDSDVRRVMKERICAFDSPVIRASPEVAAGARSARGIGAEAWPLCGAGSVKR